MKNSLDILKLIKLNNSLKVLQRLLLSKEERMLLQIQRRYSVLGNSEHNQSDESALSQAEIRRWATKRKSLNVQYLSRFEQKLLRGVTKKSWDMPLAESSQTPIVIQDINSPETAIFSGRLTGRRHSKVLEKRGY